MSNRTIILPGIWGSSAETTIPGTPSQNTPYRDTTLTASTVHSGWPFGAIVDSASFNQFMYCASTLLSQLDTQGILSWAAANAYAVGALAMGSDAQVYRCIAASTNNNPVSSPTYWTLYNATTAGVNANNGWRALGGGTILQWCRSSVVVPNQTSTGHENFSITWPIAFTNACYSAVPTMAADAGTVAGTQASVYLQTTPTTTGCVVTIDCVIGVPQFSATIMVQAIGS